jgi:hypothetical protein
MRTTKPNERAKNPGAAVLGINLDEEQWRAVAVAQARLGGTTAEVLEFLVTVGLYTLQLDPLANGRVRSGVEALFGEPLAATIMTELGDLESNLQNEAADFKIRNLRPRMAGDWRGEPLPAPAQAEA